MRDTCRKCGRDYDCRSASGAGLCDSCRFGGTSQPESIGQLLEQRDAAMREFQRIDALLFFEMKRLVTEGANK